MDLEPQGLLYPMYQNMQAVGRSFDQKCVALQRTGQLGTYCPTLGFRRRSLRRRRAMSPEDV